MPIGMIPLFRFVDVEHFEHFEHVEHVEHVELVDV